MKKKIVYGGIVILFLIFLYLLLLPSPKKGTEFKEKINADTLSNSWKIHRPIEFPRYGASACVLDGKIYVVGGKIKGTNEYVKKTEIYDPIKRDWIEGPSPNIPRAKFAMVTFGGKIYIFGGESERGIVKEVEVFDPQKNRWEIVGKMPNPRKGLSAVVFGNKIHILCGEDEREEVSLNLHDVFDPRTGEWSEGTAAPMGRHASSLVVYRNRLYLIGGWNREKNEPLKSVDVYDPEKDLWTSDSSLIVAVYAAGTGVIDDRIVVVGGFADPSGEVPLAITQYFDGKKWMMGERIPTPRGWTASAVVNDTLYIIGGTSGFDTLELVEKYSFSSR
jgi:N-acetylneuraminic acid mutarotase